VTNKIHPAVFPIAVLLSIVGVYSVGYVIYRHYEEKSFKAEVKQRYEDYKKKHDDGMSSQLRADALQDMKRREAEIRFQADVNRAIRKAERNISRN